MVYSQFQCGWVAYNSNISYIRSAIFDEWVRIYSRIAYFDAHTLVHEYYMTNDAGNELKTLLWSTLKYVDIRTGKRAEHQPEILEVLEAMFDPQFNIQGLTPKDRIAQLKAQISTVV